MSHSCETDYQFIVNSQRICDIEIEFTIKKVNSKCIRETDNDSIRIREMDIQLIENLR